MFSKPRKAATVAILKNKSSTDEFEVLLLKRHKQDKFLPSYYVFPGGGIDEQDSIPGKKDYSIKTDKKNKDDFDVYLYTMGAIRETFEESGFLLARNSNGDFVSISKDADIEKYSKYRTMIYENQLSFNEMLKIEKLKPAIESIHYLSRWITPVFSPIRYDTRFFAVLAPENQYIMHDGIELVETRWMTPKEALSCYKNKKMKMVVPTISTLEFFASFESSHDVIKHLADKGGIK